MQKDPSQRPPNLITAVRALESAFEGSGIVVRGPMSAAWDVATGDPGKSHTPWPPKRTSDVMASTAAAPLAVSSMQAAPAKSKLPLAIGLVVAAALAAGAIVMVVSRGAGDRKPETPASTAALPTAPMPPSVPPPPAAPMPPTVVEPVPAPSPTIAIEIAGAPQGSEVLLGDRVIGSAPGSIALDRGTASVDLVIRHVGYMPLTKHVVPDHDAKLDATLRRKATPAASVTKPATGVDSHDIEDPFHHH